jgi:hypothetical protein
MPQKPSAKSQKLRINHDKKHEFPLKYTPNMGRIRQEKRLSPGHKLIISGFI